MGSTCGAGTAYPTRAPEFTPGFSGIRVARSLVFCTMFYLPFAHLHLAIVLYDLLQSAATDYPFECIFNLRLPITPLKLSLIYGYRLPPLKVSLIYGYRLPL